MGRVAITMNVSLTGPDVDAEKVKSEISKISSVKETRVKDIAFGLKQLEVLMVFDDKEGANTDEIEKIIAAIDGVSSIETGEATLI